MLSLREFLAGNCAQVLDLVLSHSGCWRNVVPLGRPGTVVGAAVIVIPGCHSHSLEINRKITFLALTHLVHRMYGGVAT